MRCRGALFDLDGVLVDTAKYHYLAWRELAAKLGFDFTPEQNERLKGVSRMDSLRFLLEAGGMAGRFSQEEKLRMADWKNDRYVRMISRMDPSEILPGAVELLRELRGRGALTALGSASKNAPLILKNTGLTPLFDAVVDGNLATRAKPDPQVFELCADRLGLPYEACAVFEDSQAGLLAAKLAGMCALGIGKRENLPAADAVFPGLLEFPTEEYF